MYRCVYNKSKLELLKAYLNDNCGHQFVQVNRGVVL